MVTVQRRHRHKSFMSGQMLPIFIVILTLLLFTLGSLVKTSTLLHRKMRLQLRTDGVALSACRMQARSLNALALLNNNLERIENVSTVIHISWLAVTACALGCTSIAACPCHPAYVEYNRRAPKLLKRLREVAERIAKLQDRIVIMTPTSLSLFLKQLATDNNLQNFRQHFPAAFEKQPLYVQRRRPTPMQKTLKLPGRMVLHPEFRKLQRLQISAVDDKLHAGSAALPQRHYDRFSNELASSDWDGELEIMHDNTFSKQDTLH